MTKDTHDTCTPVGIKEIADEYSMKARTVSQWRHRQLLPPERWKVGGDPAWCLEHDIAPWMETERSRRFPASRAPADAAGGRRRASSREG
jgi:hypothetical protein